MRPVARVLILAGAAAIVLSAVLPWVTVQGRPLHLDLGLLSVSATPGGRTVSGTGTSVWPEVVGAGGVTALAALLGAPRALLLALGALAVVAGGALLYYVANIIDFRTSSSGVLEHTLATLTLTSSPGPGPPVLAGGGLAVLAGALAR